MRRSQTDGSCTDPISVSSVSKISLSSVAARESMPYILLQRRRLTAAALAFSTLAGDANDDGNVVDDGGDEGKLKPVVLSIHSFSIKCCGEFSKPYLSFTSLTAPSSPTFVSTEVTLEIPLPSVSS